MKIVHENLPVIEDRLSAILHHLLNEKTLLKDIVELECHLKQAVWHRIGFCEVRVDCYSGYDAVHVTLMVGEPNGPSFAMTRSYSHQALFYA